ncbi:MAG: hypothetical protein II105_00465 [Ruminococcus sp.]|nr:hypothetical protein [Ruminococcus sp.]
MPYGTVLSTSSNTCSCNGTTVTATPATQTAQYTYTFGSWTNGTLYGLLCRFNSLGLNLTKIESRPSAERKFEYIFYLDFTGSVRDNSVIDLLSQLSEEMPDFSFLGNYCE